MTVPGLLSLLPEQSALPRDNKGDNAPPLLLHVWMLARRWKWLIGAIIAASVLLGLVATLLITPQYTAMTRLEISREQQNITKVEGLDSPQAGQDVEFYKTQYSLLAARSLAERVVRSLRLAKNDAFFAAHGVSPPAIAPGLTQPDPQAQEERAVELLLDHVAIVPVATSSLVDVRYSSGSPEISARIANEWAEQFIAAGIDRRYLSTAYARRVLAKGLSDLAVRLEASERAARRFASANDIIALGTVRSADGKTQVERTLASSDLDALNSALSQATADRITAESRLREGGNAGASNQALASAVTAGLMQKRAEVAAEMAKLSVQFEPEYPAVRALRQQLGALDAGIARENARIRSNRVDEFRDAERRESDLRARVEQLKQRFNRQQDASTQYNVLQREADTNRQLYDSLLQRSKEVSVNDVGATNVAVIDTAKAPPKPSSPILLLNLGIALFVGLGLSALTLFALDQLDEGLRHPSDVQRLLNLPLLGSIPEQAADSVDSALFDAKSELSEAYLSVRTNLAFSTDHGVPKIFVVTSTRPSEGKSTSAAALAVVLGRTEKRVLLVDGDMRSASVHGLIGGHNEVGLSNYLAGQDDWKLLVQPTRLAGVDIMAAGPHPPSAAELLSSDRVELLMAALRQVYDHVVIDAPPLLGLADAPLLAGAAEGCLFVVEADGVPIRGLRAALARLEQAHARVFGVVLTKLADQGPGYGYGYGYGYDYKYGSAADAKV